MPHRFRLKNDPCETWPAGCGAGAPYLLGRLIETGARENVFGGYLPGAALMIFAGVVQAIFGVAAEGKPLEAVARPLSSVEKIDAERAAV